MQSSLFSKKESLSERCKKRSFENVTERDTNVDSPSFERRFEILFNMDNRLFQSFNIIIICDKSLHLVYYSSEGCEG